MADLGIRFTIYQLFDIHQSQFIATWSLRLILTLYFDICFFVFLR